MQDIELMEMMHDADEREIMAIVNAENAEAEAEAEYLEMVLNDWCNIEL